MGIERAVQIQDTDIYSALMYAKQQECALDRAHRIAEVLNHAMPYYAPLQTDPINGLKHHDGSHAARAALMSMAAGEDDSLTLLIDADMGIVTNAALRCTDDDGPHEAFVITLPQNESKSSNARQEAVTTLGSEAEMHSLFDVDGILLEKLRALFTPYVQPEDLVIPSMRIVSIRGEEMQDFAESTTYYQITDFVTRVL